MFLEQAFNKENQFWKYIIGSLGVIFVTTIGQIPFMIAVFYKTVILDKKTFPSDQGIMMKLLDSNLTLFLLTLSFAFGLVGLYFVIRFIHNQTLLSVTTSRKAVDWGRILFSFLLWTLFTITTTLISYFAKPEFFVINFHLIPFIILFLIAVIMIPLQTSCEEYIFRGYLMQGFGNLSGNKWFPLLMTSLIFGGMHLMNPEVDKMGNIIMIYYIGTGLVLGIMTLMDDGMELSLGFHAANNLVGALLVTADWTVFQTNSIFIDKSEPEVFSGILLPVFVIYPILLFIFSQKYGWSNWKEKLTGKMVSNQKNCN
ncbi:MAG: CPBP family intramembrane metalloprotease [Flavobacterium sp.]|nr:CPBP family intramembrane metalloprotease [Flavobacterium sp.]